MFKYALTIALLVISSTSLIHSGNWFSRPPQIIPATTEPQSNPYEPIQKELSSYLNGLNLEGITTEDALKQLVQDSVNTNLRNEAKFPAFAAVVKNLNENTPEGRQKAYQLHNTIMTTAEKFVEQKKSSFKQ